MGGYDLVPNGTERMESMYNGLKHISERYACEKLVIVDAVAPFLYGALIDDYFDRLDEYDAVITAQKILGGLVDVQDNPLDRENYIVTQSPEGFRFEVLWKHFDPRFPYQETSGMLPKDARRCYNFDFKNNLKLTYDFDLLYAEVMLNAVGKVNRERNVAFFDQRILLTEGLKAYLLRTNREETLHWLEEVYAHMPRLIAKWEITSFRPNHRSRFGLVLQAKSRVYGDVILKFVPEFVGRYERELEAFRFLPTSYMCALLDADEDSRSMLLEQVKPAKFACFEENLKLTELFRHAVADAVPYAGERGLKHIPFYLDELKGKLFGADKLPYCKEEVRKELDFAVGLYEREFADAKAYILHGDLHEENILDNGKRFYGIDPCGYVAPIELECVRFIRDDVRNHPAFGFEERFEILLRSFGRFVDVHRLARMFVIDMAFYAYNSVFENETDEATRTSLELIRIAKRWIARENG